MFSSILLRLLNDESIKQRSLSTWGKTENWLKQNHLEDDRVKNDDYCFLTELNPTAIQQIQYSPSHRTVFILRSFDPAFNVLIRRLLIDEATS